jgi:hypothetical protein
LKNKVPKKREQFIDKKSNISINIKSNDHFVIEDSFQLEPYSPKIQHYLKPIDNPSITLSYLQSELNILQIQENMKRIEKPLMESEFSR